MGSTETQSRAPQSRALEPMPGDVAEVNAQACRALWCSVIREILDQALLTRATWTVTHHDIDRSRAWFGSRDFYVCCALAGLDGDYILDGVRRRIARAKQEGQS